MAVAGAGLTGCGDDESTGGDGGSDAGPGSGGSTEGGNGGQGGGVGGVGATGGGGMADVCGDGTVGMSEACDDGGTAPGDGCDGSCDIENGYDCTGEPSVCAIDCGDGLILAPEDCDDGNGVAGDGCSDTCQQEAGFICPTPGMDCIEIDGSCMYPFDIVLTDNAGTLEGMVSGDTTGETSDVAEELCDGGNVGDGADLVHTFTLPDDRDVTVSATFGSADGIIRVLSMPCDPATGVLGEVAFGDGCADVAGAAGAETVTLLGMPAGTYYVVVDGTAGDEGTYTLDVSAVTSLCGNGTLDGTEECDDQNATVADGCTQCVLDPLFTCPGEPSMCVTTCQDGIVDYAALEQCDDGNNINADRCDDTCQLESDVQDAEPNDSIANAQTVLAGEWVFGTIDVGDFDIYELTLAADSWVTLETYLTIDGDATNSDNPSGQLDPLVDCDEQTGDTDIRMFLFDSTGDVTVTGDAIIEDDDDGEDRCAYIGANEEVESFLVAGTYYIRVQGFNGSRRVPQYVLDVRVDAPLALNDGCDTAFDLCDLSVPLECDGGTSTCQVLCGNGTVDSGEECDDGDADDADRCSNACLLNADVTDNGNNDTFGTAQALADGEVARGSLIGADVFDLYSITLASDSWVVIESYTSVDADPGNYQATAGGNDELDCESDDTQLRVFDSAGDPTDNNTALVFDDDAGDGLCSYMGPNTDGSAVFLAAGTYYIKMSEFGEDDDIPLYAIDLQVLAPLSIGATCVQTLDLCDPTESIFCDGTDTCIAIAPDSIDRTNWENFSGNDFDLTNTTLTFTPNGGTFGVVATTAAGYPDTPGAGTVSTATGTIADDGSEPVTYTFDFYGTSYTTVHVNGNGNLTFGGSSGSAFESVGLHFDTPRISFLFDDLDVSSGGTVTYDEYPDRLTITFDNVPNFGGSAVVQAQVTLVPATGAVVITHLATTNTDGLVGLSAGDDLGNEPAEIDFSAQVVTAPGASSLIINEFFADPFNGTTFDSNCDTTPSSTQDEFVELVNVSGVPLDLTGVQISDLNAVQHVFGSVVLGAGRAIVVYGGGTSMCPDVNGVVASTGSLSLNNSNETITVETTGGGLVIDQVMYTTAGNGTSDTLDHDIIGIFREHDIAGGSTTLASPGFRVNLEAF